MRCSIFLASLLLAGCSLPSISLPTGGSTAANESIGASMYRIAMQPRSPSHCASADECTLLAAAAVAKRVGGTHFIVVPGHGSLSQREFAYIKVFTLRDGELPPSGAVSTEEALYFLAKRPGTFASNSWASVTRTLASTPAGTE